MDINEAFNLGNKTALVTGGTRGIGAAIAEEFALSGAHVLITGRKLSDAQRLAGRLSDAGGQATGFAYDAAQADSQRRLLDQLAGVTGQLDVLVNNAAILRPHRIQKLSEDEFDEIFTVNTRAAVFLCQLCQPLLKCGKQPSVINITAAGAHRPMAGIGAYCASKAAMINFTATLAQEWAADGIRVNALTPGSVATDMILPVDADQRAQFSEQMAAQNLMNRLAEPREIARAVRFLASEASSFMTGQTLVVDGGFLCR